MPTITEKEANDWLDAANDATLVSMIQDYHRLKQELCSQILHVPTGCDNWIDRAIHAAYKAKKCESQLSILIHKAEIAVAEARNEVVDLLCTNCFGAGLCGEKSCTICRGTGRKSL